MTASVKRLTVTVQLPAFMTSPHRRGAFERWGAWRMHFNIERSVSNFVECYEHDAVVEHKTELV